MENEIESSKTEEVEELTEFQHALGSWYIAHCYSGMEDRVKRNLEQRIGTMEVEDKVFEVVIPTEEIMEIKDGRKTPKLERLFPGYVLVRMEMDDESWYVVRNTPGVTGFISADDEQERRAKPLPLTDAEVNNILHRMQVSEPRAKIGLTKGQNVKITDGPFREFIGVVDEVQIDKGKLLVLVSFFGRETPVELDFLQVERIG
jgi:transcriptional antiterminator NusG